MFVNVNVNPYGADIDDCLIRAITLGTGKSYFDVLDDMIKIADEKGWEINELRTGMHYLYSLNWEMCELIQPQTVKQFSATTTDPRIVIVNGHATFCKDGNVYDTWNCNRYKVKYVFRMADV